MNIGRGGHVIDEDLLQRWTQPSPAPFWMFSTKSLCRSIILIGTTQRSS